MRRSINLDIRRNDCKVDSDSSRFQKHGTCPLEGEVVFSVSCPRVLFSPVQHNDSGIEILRLCLLPDISS